jgi:hypothetical protein
MKRKSRKIWFRNYRKRKRLKRACKSLGIQYIE